MQYLTSAVSCVCVACVARYQYAGGMDGSCPRMIDAFCRVLVLLEPIRTDDPAQLNEQLGLRSAFDGRDPEFD